MRRFILTAALTFISIFVNAGDFDAAILSADGVGNFAPRVLMRQNVGTGCVSRGAKGPDLFAQASKFNGFQCVRYICKGYEDGVPVFQKKAVVKMPDNLSYTLCFSEINGKSALFWINGKYLRYAFLDEATNEFVQAGKLLAPQLAGLSAFAVQMQKDESLKLYAVICTQKNERPGDWRSEDFRPYDATGVYRGRLAQSKMCRFEYKSLDDVQTVPQVQMLCDLPGNHTTPAFVYVEGHIGVVSCNHTGGIYFLEEMLDGDVAIHRVCDPEGNAARSISCSARAGAYPSRSGNTSLIVTTEGAVEYCSFVRRMGNGNLAYSELVALKEKNPPLTGGTLIVPTCVDWDADGKIDIVYGNSSGHILWYRNRGTNEKPSFLTPEFLKAGGERIHIQPGYGEDIQGPGESRWGYVGPNVYDWNGDGFLDILTNDSRGKHNVFVGTDAGLRPEHPLYLDDMPIHGMWRCRPGVGELGGRIAYITLDDQDEFHLYFREDDYNLLDGGKLHLSDGRNIRANFLEAGGKGRLRFEITDWDGDGVKDLLLATNKHNMIPADDPAGLPWSNPKELRGSTILFLRNAGTESAPAFEFPRQLKYDGKLIRLGHHGCGACVTMLGQITDGKPNILAGDEAGNFYLFERSRLSW